MTAQNLPVIVTRAQPGAAETAARVSKLGLSPILAPALYVQPNIFEDITYHKYLSGLVFTSANGVRCYKDRAPYYETPAWCVGPATAKAAHDAGFKTVYESAGNAIDLARYIAAHSEPDEKPLLHIANQAAKGDLKRELESLGFEVEFCPLYEMRISDALPTDALEALKSDDPVILMVHSAKGAEAFVQLAQNKNLHNIIAIAISKQAAQPLNALQIGSTHIANAPNEDGMFGALNEAVATLSA